MKETGNLEIRRYEGGKALRDLAARLLSSGFPPARDAEMDPEYLAEGIEGNSPGAIVAAVKDRPVAYMPYVLRRIDFPLAFGPGSLGRLPCWQLRLYGYAMHDDGHGPILDMFFKSLLEVKGWHVAQIFDLPTDSPLAGYVTRMPIDGGRRYCLTSRIFDTIQVRIDDDFESYLQSHFTKKTRYNLKREVRLLEAAAPGQVVVRVYKSADQVTDFLRDAEGIARRTYQWRLGLNTMRATPSQIRTLSYLAKGGRWRSYILFIRGVPAAYCYATIRGDQLSYDNIGYDPRFAKLNPGKVLLYKILEDLHECRLVNELEFGRGPSEYKLLFANSSRRALDVSLYRYQPYAQLLRLLAGSADAGYQWLRPLMQPLMPYVKRMATGRLFRFLTWSLSSLVDL